MALHSSSHSVSNLGTYSAGADIEATKILVYHGGEHERGWQIQHTYIYIVTLLEGEIGLGDTYLNCQHFVETRLD